MNWCVILILESPLSWGHFSCVEMFKLQVIVEHSALTLGLEPQAKGRAWYSPIHLNMWKKWVQEAQQNQLQNTRLLNAQLSLDMWITQAYTNWLMQKETGFHTTEDSRVSMLPWSPPRKHPSLLLFRSTCCSTHVLKLCTCSFSHLFGLFLQMAAHPLPSFKSLLIHLLSEAIHSQLPYDCNPIYPTPSSPPQLPLSPFSIQFFSKVLIPIECTLCSILFSHLSCTKQEALYRRELVAAVHYWSSSM